MFKKKEKYVLIVITCMFALYMLFFISAEYSEKVSSSNGKFDIYSRYDDNKIYNLKGKWKFTNNNLNCRNNKILMDVPGSWDEAFEKNGKGIGIYEAQIRVPKQHEYMFVVNNVRSAYEIYINGRKAACNGTIGSSLKDETAKNELRLISCYSRDDYINVVIKVSNYTSIHGGICDEVLFGSCRSINRWYVAYIMKGSICIGAFMAIGTYIMMLFKIKERKIVYLYLSIFCYSLVILEFVLNNSIIYYVYTKITFGILTKIIYIGLISLFLSMELYIKTLFNFKKDDTISSAIYVYDSIYLCIILFAPYRYFSYNSISYIIMIILHFADQIFITYKSLKSKYKFSYIFSLNITTVITVSILPLIYYNNINCAEVFNDYGIGFIMFILVQLYILSADFKDAFDEKNKKKNIEMAYLQAQISPHFIFNTLNNIYCYIDSSQTKAKEMILDLSDILRGKYMFDYRNAVYYTLFEELSLVKSYIRILNKRFDDSIDLKIKVDAKYMKLKIPPFTIQPIVGNCIKHGMKNNKIKIEINAEENQNNTVYLKIKDNGVGINKMRLKEIHENLNTGTGLKNIKTRMKKCFDTELIINSTEGIGTEVLLCIPMEERTYENISS